MPLLLIAIIAGVSTYFFGMPPRASSRCLATQGCSAGSGTGLPAWAGITSPNTSPRCSVLAAVPVIVLVALCCPWRCSWTPALVNLVAGAAVSATGAQEGRFDIRERALVGAVHRRRAAGAGGVVSLVADSCLWCWCCAASGSGVAHLSCDELLTRSPNMRARRSDRPRAPSPQPARHWRGLRFSGRRAQSGVGLGGHVRGGVSGADSGRHLDLHTGVRVFLAGSRITALRPLERLRAERNEAAVEMPAATAVIDEAPVVLPAEAPPALPGETVVKPGNN